MSKERLEEIETKYSTLTVSSEKNGTEYTEVDVEDLVFLIQNGFKQVERVQELEEDLIEQGEYYEELQNNHVRVSNQNKRYREALEFYADKENYKPIDGIFLSNYQNKVDEDNGEKARKALEESQ